MAMAIFQALFLALVLAVAEGSPVQQPEVCQPVAASCRSINVSSAKMCSSIISSQRIPITKCRKSQKTVTTTVTTSPTTTSTRTIRATTTTKTVTSTQTLKGPTVTPPPTTLPVVVQTTTDFQTTISTISEVVVDTRYENEYVYTTSTVFTFFIESTWIPWTQDYCAAPTRRNVIEFVHDIFKRDDEDAEVDLYAEYMSEHPEQLDPALEDNILRYRGAAGFPSDCSCFLTSTMLDGAPSTKTSTTTRSVTTTTTRIIGGSAPTQTTTLTVKQTKSIPGTTFPQVTESPTTTTTEKKTVTESTTETSTSWTTTTWTGSGTRWVYVGPTSSWTFTNWPCGPDGYGHETYSGNAAHPTFEARTTHEANRSPYACCQSCYRYGCVMWAMETDGVNCLNFYAEPGSGRCTSPQCQRGFPEIVMQPEPDGRNYHPGPCGNKVAAAQTTL